MRLADRVAVVTGAQQGIGKAIAVAFARQGARVVVNYLDDRAAADGIVREIEEIGSAATAVAGDVTDAAGVARMMDAAAEFGGVDLLANNAGIFPRVGFLEMTEADWDRVFDVNLKGVFRCAQIAARRMVERGVGGAIINISSISAFKGNPRGVHYAATKAGVIGFTRSAAVALAPHRIRVNAIAPGLTDTAQPRHGETEESIAAWAARMPLGRIISPDEVADAAVFLAAAESQQITGQTIHVNGGDFLY